ncbi:MAG: helix-turn-helix transcriptional regulator [Clostridia bacterium]|nr:helix-turn-helix transcriptional regulator [Clostridia bacterium]
MDVRKTGRFIANLRHEKGLTQKELADELSVSDKAVSRWETGKGYPDIPSLVAISEFFSVSINEIIYAEKITTPEVEKNVQIEIAKAYVGETIKKKRISKLAVAGFIVAGVCSILIIIYIALIAFNIKGQISNYYADYGKCYIADDYNSLTFEGKRYVSVDIGMTSVMTGNEKICSAYNKGTGPVSSLFYADKVYPVIGCENYDIIYLSTDYDENKSDVFIAEDKVEHYLDVLEMCEFTDYVAEMITQDGKSFTVELNPDLSEYIDNLTIDNVTDSVDSFTMRSRGDETVEVFKKQKNSPFHKNIGMLFRKGGEYYWSFTYSTGKDFYKYYYYDYGPVYVIDDKFDLILDELFSRQLNKTLE